MPPHTRLQLNGVYQDENTTLGQVSRAQSDNGQSAILDVLIADGPPVYIEDYPTDPGIGVTMKRGPCRIPSDGRLPSQPDSDHYRQPFRRGIPNPRLADEYRQGDQGG